MQRQCSNSSLPSKMLTAQKKKGYCMSVKAFYLLENDNKFPKAQGKLKMKSSRGKWRGGNCNVSVWQCRSAVVNMNTYALLWKTMLSHLHTTLVEAQSLKIPVSAHIKHACCACTTFRNACNGNVSAGAYTCSQCKPSSYSGICHVIASEHAEQH